MSDTRRAAEVIAFWLVETAPEKRFTVDPALDRAISVRFAGLREAVVASHAAGWRAAPETLLAAVILTDQFSRNLFRGRAEAFASDPLARALAGEALARGWDQVVGRAERQFLYLPFMHAEDMAGQVRSLALCRALGDAEQLFYAEGHARMIARFGRFPGRNAALGRVTTAEEAAALAAETGWEE